MHSILLQFEVKLEKSSYTIGFSTEFEVNLKERPLFFLENTKIIGKKLVKMEMKFK